MWLTYGQISVTCRCSSAAGFLLFVRFWLKGGGGAAVAQLSAILLAASDLPVCVLIILLIRHEHDFSPAAISGRGLEDVLFFLALCAMILVVYVMILNSTLEIVSRRKRRSCSLPGS